MPNYRNPNGYGSVVKLSGNRRKPFAVRKTVGYDDRTYPIYAIIGYYQKREEAMIALSKFNQDPYDLGRKTFKQVFELLEEQNFPKMSASLVAQHKASFKHCKNIYDVPYVDLRKFHFQKVIDECETPSVQRIVKNLLVTMDKFAYDMEIVTKMRTANLTVAHEETKIVRQLYTHDEVETLWKHQGEPFIDETLFCLYTGCRVSEMILMRCANIDLEQGIMRGGVKTEAGKNRVIPIHDRLKPVIERHLSDNEYLFTIKRSGKNPNDSAVNRYEYGMKKALKALGMNHRTHDCRHSFRSQIDGADKVCIDLIMGHKTGDIGERVYTHKTIEALKQTINTLSF